MMPLTRDKPIEIGAGGFGPDRSTLIAPPFAARWKPVALAIEIRVVPGGSPLMWKKPFASVRAVGSEDNVIAANTTLPVLPAELSETSTLQFPLAFLPMNFDSGSTGRTKC